MSRTRKIIKWSLISIGSIIISVVLFGVWFINLLPEPTVSRDQLKNTLPSELPYLTNDSVPSRGKILAIVTSTAIMGSTDKSTGYELTELSRAYYVFKANGFEVDIASPLGGTPPVVIDKGDMKEFDYAFLNDSDAQYKSTHTIPVKDIEAANYEAVYFVGGKGAMFDFPENKHIQGIVQQLFESNKVIGAVCHGPAALVNVKLSSGQPLIANKQVSSFTNKEELLLIPDAKNIFPFLLEDKLTTAGAKFSEGAIYLNNVSVDGNLVTGQNPWSTWTVAESIITQLGYTPKSRLITAEENSAVILDDYNKAGYETAKRRIEAFSNSNRLIDYEMLAVHSLLAAYRLELSKFFQLIQLLRYSKTFL